MPTTSSCSAACAFVCVFSFFFFWLEISFRPTVLHFPHSFKHTGLNMASTFLCILIMIPFLGVVSPNCPISSAACLYRITTLPLLATLLSAVARVILGLVSNALTNSKSPIIMSDIRVGSAGVLLDGSTVV